MLLGVPGIYIYTYMPSKSKEIKETIFSDGFPSQRLLLRIIFHTSTAGISNHSKGGLVGGWTTPLKNSQIGNLPQVSSPSKGEH